MSFLKAKRGTSGIRGRPRGSGFIKKPEDKSTIPAKLSQNLWAFLQAQRKMDETLSETIFRLIRQANHDRNAAIKKVDALEKRLQQFYNMYATEQSNK